MRIRLSKLAAGALIVVAACHDSTAPTHHAPLSIVAGSGATDTVGTKLTQALVVQIYGSDQRPVSHTVVRFTGLPASTPPFILTALVAPLTSRFFSDFAVDSTDGDGRASTLVQLGSLAGPAKVLISVPELGLQDTARFTVLPGAAAIISISIRDTTVVRGAQYSIAAAAADRFGNKRPNDPITYTSRNAVASVDAGGKITAVQEGRGTIVVQSANAKDSAQLSVVPQGTLVVWGGGRISTIKTDGSGLKTLTTSSDASVMPQWSPDGTKVLFYEADPASNARISTVDMNGAKTLVVGPNATLRAASYGRFTRDGSWIYFSGISATDYYYAYTTYRVKPDGTQLEQIGPTSAEGNSLRPDISPDGTTEVFQTPGGVLGSMNLATHTIKSFGINGVFPRYSPDGSQIAYLAGSYGQYGPMQLYVMKADGTGVRQVSNTGNVSYQELSGVDWSPDGQWLVASSYYGTFDLVRVSDGLRLPLRTVGLQAAWKP
jgi:roadblock/LC7 domain-containing protein